ncbi:MAG: hypothetical protein DRO96_01070 [Candidatus Aenigmatarchaeota archaeon]|nr:MAG: hypothetical protein DRO96_01070 [Candidatus Aenigmarchaeota archaeon]
MSNLSIYATQFDSNSKSLTEFEDSLSFFRDNQAIRKDTDVAARLQKILDVLHPITEDLQGRFSSNIHISETTISDILYEWHNQEWPTYKQKLMQLVKKLQEEQIQLLTEDFVLLNDVADALDSECQGLFKRMRGGK